jgi:hypothetical protein
VLVEKQHLPRREALLPLNRGLELHLVEQVRLQPDRGAPKGSSTAPRHPLRTLRSCSSLLAGGPSRLPPRPQPCPALNLCPLAPAAGWILELEGGAAVPLTAVSEERLLDSDELALQEGAARQQQEQQQQAWVQQLCWSCALPEGARSGAPRVLTRGQVRR